MDKLKTDLNDVDCSQQLPINVKPSIPLGMYEIYGVRIYNRELTASELAHNHKIDQARFNR